MTWSKLIGALLTVGGLAFALMGGEYDTLDWLTLRQEIESERQLIAELQWEVDSLSLYADAIESDSATQERVAREKFGMLREGEILYRVEPGERPGR